MNLKPANRSQLPEHETLFAITESILGFVPNSMLIMSRDPTLMYAFSMLTSAVLKQKVSASPLTMLRMGIKQLVRLARMQRSARSGISHELKWLVAYVTSHSAGCRYCQSHTAYSAGRAGVSTERIRMAFAFEGSELFSDAERAALRLAVVGGTGGHPSPDLVRDIHAHFRDEEVVEIVSVIALFGFLNRWNSLLDTELETIPARYSQETLRETQVHRGISESHTG